MERMGRPLFGGPEFVDVDGDIYDGVGKGSDNSFFLKFVELFDFREEFHIGKILCL